MQMNKTNTATAAMALRMGQFSTFSCSFLVNMGRKLGSVRVVLERQLVGTVGVAGVGHTPVGVGLGQTWRVAAAHRFVLVEQHRWGACKSHKHRESMPMANTKGAK